MSERAGKHRKIYVYHPKDISKTTCLVHGSGNQSDEWKVLGDFGSKYGKSRPTKERRKNPTNRFNRKQENNAIVNHAVDKIYLQENDKVISKEEAQENIESEFYENDLYQIDNMSLDDKKENTEWGKREFEFKLKITYEIEIQIGMTCILGNKLNK